MCVRVLCTYTQNINLCPLHNAINTRSTLSYLRQGHQSIQMVTSVNSLTLTHNFRQPHHHYTQTVPLHVKPAGKQRPTGSAQLSPRTQACCEKTLKHVVWCSFTGLHCYNDILHCTSTHTGLFDVHTGTCAWSTLTVSANRHMCVCVTTNYGRVQKNNRTSNNGTSRRNSQRTATKHTHTLQRHTHTHSNDTHTVCNNNTQSATTTHTQSATTTHTQSVTTIHTHIEVTTHTQTVRIHTQR